MDTLPEIPEFLLVLVRVVLNVLAGEGVAPSVAEPHVEPCVRQRKPCTKTHRYLTKLNQKVRNPSSLTVK